MPADAKKPPEPPVGCAIHSRGQGEERRVVLDIEGTTFELHPDDARVIGECLIIAAGDAAEHENG